MRSVRFVISYPNVPSLLPDINSLCALDAPVSTQALQ
jgi:hypothetical protein